MKILFGAPYRNFIFSIFFCQVHKTHLDEHIKHTQINRIDSRLFLFFFFLEIERNSIEAHDALQTKCGELCNYRTVNTLNQNYSTGTGIAL